MKENIRSIYDIFIGIAILLFIPAIIYFVNNYYLGWIMYALSIGVLVILVIGVFASGSGVPIGLMIPFAILLYFADMIIEKSNKEDGIIVNTKIFASTQKITFIPNGY